MLTVSDYEMIQVMTSYATDKKFTGFCEKQLERGFLTPLQYCKAIVTHEQHLRDRAAAGREHTITVV